MRRPDWTELFFDLVFAAAISQLGAPLEHDFSIHGIIRYSFLLALVFLAWFGYSAYSTQYSVDDVLQRGLLIAQVFLVAVMAANATISLGSRDAAGFGAAYGGVRAILVLQYLRVIRLRECHALARKRAFGLFSSAAIWASSALFDAPVRYVGWVVALALDAYNSWPSSRGTTQAPPGATHFPERFGLLTIILLGEFVASVMRGIESQKGWSFLAASAAVLSLALGFAIWSCYSDGAKGWEVRQVRSHRDVVRLRAWIALHLVLFLAIGILGVGVRRAIALEPGQHFSDVEQAIVCLATAGLMLVLAAIAGTSEHSANNQRQRIIGSQAGVLLFILTLTKLEWLVNATTCLLILFLAVVGQTLILRSRVAG